MLSSLRYLLAILCLPGLVACGQTVDSDRLAQTIQQGVIKQGGVTLKSVTCPKGVKPEAGRSFECVGELDTGYTFTIPVKQQDEQGNFVWDVPNTRGMLNLVKFETLVQDVVKTEVGSRPVIRCGQTLYRAVKPGETFECQLERKPEKASEKPSTAAKTAKAVKVVGKADKIVVNVDAQTNVSWQRIVPESARKPALAAAQTKQPTATAQKVAEQPASTPAAPAALGKKTAEDFLNQPDASAGFED